MHIDCALDIVGKLRDGLDPQTGEKLSADSVFQQADTVRALFVAVEALERMKRSAERQKSLPPGAGRAWTPEEEQKLLAQFEATKDVPAIAAEFHRTPGAIWSRLVKLGKVSPLDRPGGPRQLRSSRILSPRQLDPPASGSSRIGVRQHERRLELHRCGIMPIMF